MKFNARKRIYAVLAIWLAVSAGMVGYFFKILDDANQLTENQIQQQKQELAVLEAERNSYQQARQDLSSLARQSLQPEDFFSKDVTLVNEIKTLENLGAKYGLNLNLSGLSGTVDSAAKAKTQGELFQVPYAMSLSGSLANVDAFIENLENLDFITTLNSLSISAASNSQVNANLTASFYLRKQ